MFEQIPFGELASLSDSTTIVFTGVVFELPERDIQDVDGFLHEIHLLPEESHVTDMRPISGNVLGDEGRSDVLIIFDQCSPNPLARLQVGGWVKWTSDFVTNFANDYNV